jgi:hypothetical protein
MRRTGVSAIVLLALLLSTSSATGAHGRQKAPGKCPPGHSRPVAADAQAQVYEAFQEPQHLAFFGCAYAHKKQYLLGQLEEGGPQGSEDSREYTLAGPIVAYEERSTTKLFPGARSIEEVVVRDLRDGRILHSLPTGTSATPPRNGDVGIGSTTAIVVKSDGAVAWIVATNTRPYETQVHAVDATGSRVLAASSAIDGSSLALAGSTIYWTQGGVAMSGALR